MCRTKFGYILEQFRKRPRIVLETSQNNSGSVSVYIYEQHGTSMEASRSMFGIGTFGIIPELCWKHSRTSLFEDFWKISGIIQSASLNIEVPQNDGGSSEQFMNHNRIKLEASKNNSGSVSDQIFVYSEVISEATQNTFGSISELISQSNSGSL